MGIKKDILVGTYKYGKEKVKKIIKEARKKRKKKSTKRVNENPSLDPYAIRAQGIIPHKAQSQKGSTFQTHKVRGEQAKASSRAKYDSPGSWRREMDRMYGDLHEGFSRPKVFKKTSGGDINTSMANKYTKGYGLARTHGMGLQDESLRPGKIYSARTGKSMKKQGYYDREDESIGMRLGKGKATAKNKKKAKAERDMSYGKWGKRKGDWKKKVKKANQGYYAREDESIGMRLGAKKSKHAKKVARDESYGKWGNRSHDWKKKVVKARGGVHVKTKLNGTLYTETF
jgi:hypothetical protein